MKTAQENHLTDEELDLCMKEGIEFQKKEKLLMHIEKCTYCSDRFANRIPLDLLPPSFLQEEILSNVNKMELQFKKQIRKTSKEVQLFFYTLKVAFTVSVSIVLLFICVGSYHELGLHDENNNYLQNKYEAKMNHFENINHTRQSKEKNTLTEVLNKFAEDCFQQY